MQSTVKQERHDEAEIRELAEKIRKANGTTMQAPVVPPAATPAPPGLELLISKIKENMMTPIGDKNVGDEESVLGRFGWVTLGKSEIPYIIRTGEKYCAVRVVEMIVLNKYLRFLHKDIYNCTCIESYYITEAEVRLLNEINFIHCNGQYGWNHFTSQDVIVRLIDVVEFYNFLDVCYTKLKTMTESTNPVDRCGFIRINKESVVPYTIHHGEKYVPMFYFEDDSLTLQLNADTLEGWDLCYLKFCCKLQGIRNELFCDDTCTVISLADVKKYFPTDTLFENYWPNKVNVSQLLISGKTQNSVGQWIRKPVGSPMPHIRQPAFILVSHS